MRPVSLAKKLAKLYRDAGYIVKEMGDFDGPNTRYMRIIRDESPLFPHIGNVLVRPHYNVTVIGMGQTKKQEHANERELSQVMDGPA